MKSKLVPSGRDPFRVGGFQSRTAALIASAAICACTAVRLDAAVIDDFEGPVKFLPGSGGMDHLQASLTNGQMVWSGQFPGPFDSIHFTRNYDNVYWPSSLPSAGLEGLTLEVRTDLVRVSADGVLLFFGAGGPSGWYYIIIGQNEIALAKGTDMGETICFFTNAPITSQSITVVLALTQTDNSLLLTTRVVAQGTGEILFNRSFRDGPGQDAGVPVPPPWGVSAFKADPGAPWTSFTYAWAGVVDTRTDPPPPLEVVLDNLEYDLYDAPSLEIANSVLLSWSENTAEEQIVVAADSLTDPVWTPWPEPIYKRHGELCMAVPVTANQQFFMTVPGTQFIDDFDRLQEPFAARNPWIPQFVNPSDASRFTLTITNGAFQIQTQAQPISGQVGVEAPGAGELVGDFHASVDLLDWASSQESALGIAGRVQGTPGAASNMYLGSLRLNPTAGTGSLWFFDGASDTQATDAFDVSPDSDYRLEFSAVGNQLRLRLVRLEEPPTLVAEGQLQTSRFTRGRVGLWVNTRGSTSYSRTLDNFFVTGTTP